VGLPCARHPAGYRRKAAGEGLGTGDRAQLSLPAGEKGLGEKRQGRQPQYLRSGHHPARLQRAFSFVFYHKI